MTKYVGDFGFFTIGQTIWDSPSQISKSAKANVTFYQNREGKSLNICAIIFYRRNLLCAVVNEMLMLIYLLTSEDLCKTIVTLVNQKTTQR